MQENDGEMSKYVQDALNKMNLDYLDLVLVHWPIPEYLYATICSLNELKEKGLIRNIGVCNVRLGHLKRIQSNVGILPDFPLPQPELFPWECEVGQALCQAGVPDPECQEL